ncbi:polyprenyl synthetase family protein [Candidatus Gracilibacteria bacterium]|nr:polyprenyl synthetase family protein [Candidatus Gracilibacteria bacterium]
MLPEWYIARRNFVETEIEQYLKNKYKSSEIQGLKSFQESLIYACKGGKKLRAILALEFYLTLKNISFSKFLAEKNTHKEIIYFMLALEFVHAYSLVHDDLPCMDNDTLRRGKPTVWKKYGEWQAVLVGDTLNTLSFEVISELQDAKKSVQLTNLLSKAVGFEGMIGGQIMDLYFEEHCEEINIVKLTELHNKKTGALIKASVQGAVLVSGKMNFLHKLTPFGEKLGLAFQIKDDILDEEGSIGETGKSVGDGEEKGFVYFLGLENSKIQLKKLLSDCKLSIKILKSNHINFLVDYIGNRKK